MKPHQQQTLADRLIKWDGGSPQNRPYCDNCGYSLVGCTESSKCPECGLPLVDVLMRDSLLGGHSRRYVSRRRLFGLPLIAIAYGPASGERVGRPVGVIAIGDAPRGVIAVGGFSIGIFAFGGASIGVVSWGGAAAGLLSIGGLSIGMIALGGCAIGGWALGGMCLYLIKGVGGATVPLLP